jgi:LPS sulfotransferase NodH
MSRAKTWPEEADPPPRYVSIACTLRSGSNLLCDVLRANGFGEPREWFQDGTNSGPDMRLPGAAAARLRRQTEEFLAAHRGAAWRSAKFNWRQFRRASEVVARQEEFAALWNDLHAGCWIVQHRADLAGQAVSLYAAQLTGAWMGESSADYDLLAEDFDAIHERFAWLAAEEYAWDAYFRARRMTPLRLVYEDMVAWPRDRWCDLLQTLSPDFATDRLDLSALKSGTAEHPKVAGLKRWFREQLLAGREPMSVATALETLKDLAARLQTKPSVDGELGRVAADLIVDRRGFELRKFNLAIDLQNSGAAVMVARDHFLDRIALRLEADATSGFVAQGRRIMIQFLAHAWSGIASVSVDDDVEQIDLFAQRPETRHYIRELPPGRSVPVTICATGAKHLLSEGCEVWVQRIFVLAGGAG